MQHPKHIFTDSKYARDILLSPNHKKTNFLLVDDTKSIATRLLRDQQIPVTIHWIPSHIEKTSVGTYYIWGNHYADKQADIAQKISKGSDTCRQTKSVRENVLTCVLHLLESIGERLNIATEKQQGPPSSPDGPSSQEDDFDVSVDASQGSAYDPSDT